MVLFRALTDWRTPFDCLNHPGVLSSQHFPLAACSQAFFVAGSLVCVVEFLLNAGTQSVGAQMARSYAFEGMVGRTPRRDVDAPSLGAAPRSSWLTRH